MYVYIYIYTYTYVYNDLFDWDGSDRAGGTASSWWAATSKAIASIIGVIAMVVNTLVLPVLLSPISLPVISIITIHPKDSYYIIYYLTYYY